MKNYKELSDYDMFGYNVGLYFNGNIKEGTLFGIICTIIYIISFIIVTIYYTAGTFSRKNFTFTTSTMKHEDVATINLDKEILSLNFALEDPINYTEYIDETIYYIKANYITAIRDPITQGFSWYYEEIKTGPCTLDMFEKDNQRFFKDSYKNNYCLYGIDKKNLSGHFVFDHYSKIKISFYRCVNSTENNNHCKSKNIIDYYLNNSYFSMLLQSITIDQNQIPMTRNYIENPFTIISQYTFTNYQIFLKIIETEDDTGMIINSKKYRKLLQFDYSTNMYALNDKIYDIDSFCQIDIKLSDIKTVYKRKFEKIQDAFSKAGSIMTLIYSFIQFCSWLPVKTVYEVNVINKVFRFDINTAMNKMNESNISRHVINFKSENNFKKFKGIKNELNINAIKNKNEENIREMSKDNNFNFMNSKKSNSNINKLNIKIYSLDDSNVKRIDDNSYMSMNNIIKKRSFYINQIRNSFKEDSKNKRRRRNLKSKKTIVDFIKFNCCQLICYYPTRHCSNNIKINLAKNAQKFFRKTLDIINVFQNSVTTHKIYKLIVKNQRIFEIYDKEFFCFRKPIITNSRIDNI